jgi:hypothetical protein
LNTLVDRTSEDEEDDPTGFPDWPTYRDNFIMDWIANRTVVTAEEADIMFDRDVDQALQVIEQAEVAETQATIAEALPPVVEAPVVVVAKKKSYAKAKKKAGAKTVKAKAPKKAAAKKKSSAKGSASAKAQIIIEKYAAKGWARKDILAKLQSQLDMGAAYAATLYQKFA